MKMNLKSLIAALFITGLALDTPALADVRPVALPQSPRLVVFQYDANNSYSITTAPGNVTDIVLAPDETVVTLALGDSVQWVTANAAGNHVFVRPSKEDLRTSATLVTNKRTYQLTLNSVKATDPWHQRVSWNYVDIIVMQKAKEEERKEAEFKKNKELEATVAIADFSIENLDFEYKIEGEAEFKPLHVFNNGQSTWIKLKNQPELPALFLVDEDGKTSLANYAVKGDFIFINRLFEHALLKLGKKEIHIYRGKKRGFFGG